jgi:hypothetical protein
MSANNTTYLIVYYEVLVAEGQIEELKQKFENCKKPGCFTTRNY